MGACAVLVLGTAGTAAAESTDPLLHDVRLGATSPARPEVSEETPVDLSTDAATGRFGPRQFVTPNILGRHSLFNVQTGPPSVSGDGTVVAYDSDQTGLLEPDVAGWDVYYEVDGQRYRPYDEASLVVDGTTYDAALGQVSRDGRVILFGSVSPAIIKGDHNRTSDLFAYDRTTGLTDRVNLFSDGRETTQRLYTATEPGISADGRYIAFVSDEALVPDDTNNTYDVYVRDRTLRTTTRVSVASDGAQGNNASGFDAGKLGISGDGRYVTFSTLATNLTPSTGVGADTNPCDDVVVRDRLLGTTERVSVADDGTGMTCNPQWGPETSTRAVSVSDDGRYVAFYSQGLGLDGLTFQPGRDVYLRDRLLKTTRLISRHNGRPSGRDYGNGSYWGQLTPDGRYVTFDSISRIMNPPVPGELTNPQSRVDYAFVYVVATGQLIRLPDPSTAAVLTDDASEVVYQKIRFRTIAQAIARRTIHLPS